MIKLIEIITHYENTKVFINIYQISSIKYSKKYDIYCITMYNGDNVRIDNDNMKKLMEVIDHV